MASIPGRTLEAFVEDSYFFNGPDDPRIASIVAAFEPWRDSIECQLERFEEGEQSWRDYRNAMLANLDEEAHKLADAIMAEPDKNTMLQNFLGGSRG